jgi:flagellar hook-associated protein FlgK
MVQYQQAYDVSGQVIATIHDMMYAVINSSRLTV